MTDIERIGKLPGPLRITCHGCGHSVVWSKEEAIDRIGGWRQPYCARVALRCSGCQAKREVSFDTGSHLQAYLVKLSTAQQRGATIQTMCNRYGYKHPYERLVDEFSIIRPLRWAAGPQTNLREGDVTIGDTAPVIRIGPEAAELSAVKWAWKGPTGRPVFNFKSEKRDFGGSDRILIPAAQFYEFTGTRSPKTRWTFALADSDLLMIAGIVKQGAFAMLTGDPGPDIAPYHDRQVVVLREKAEWLAWGDAAQLPGPLPAGSLIVAQG